MSGELLAIARRVGANKIRQEVCHYCDLYERLLPRGAPLRLLEIGVQSGRSIRMWREWLGPSAHLGGIDIGGIPPDCGLDWSYEGPQQEPETWAAAIAAGPWDMLIDDGSHNPSHQIATATALWPAVGRGGWYVIEDCNTSYWPREGHGNAVAWAGDRLHDLNVWARQHERSNQEWQRRAVVMPGLVEVVAQRHIIAFHKGG